MTHLYKYFIGCLFKLHFRYILLLSIALIFITVLTGYGQVKYIWQPTSGSNLWTNAANWSSSPGSLPRTTPAATDILEFSKGGIVTLTNVPTQTIQQLLVLNNTNVTLQAASNNLTLTISGAATGTDLNISAGAALNISSNNILNIRLSALATGSISGNMAFSGNAIHTMDATDANAIVINNGAVFTQNSNGNAFTTTNTNNTVIFASGSTFISNNGGNPFGKAIPNSKVVFQTGSLYKYTQTSTEPAISGRTFADFEIDAPTYTQTSAGSNGLTVDNFKVTNVATMSITLTGGINIKGNLTVLAGNLNFLPGSANTITFNATGTQIIGGAGNIATNTNTSIVVAGTSNTILNKSFTSTGSLQIDGNLKFDNTTAQTLTVTGSLSGTGTLDMSSGDLTHILNLGGATNTNVTIIQGASCNSSVNYNRAGNQTIFVGNYANLTIAGSGTKILQGDISVCKTLTVAAGASLTLATYEADVSVSTTIGGTLDAGTGAIKGAGSFTLNNTATLVSASPDGISTGTTVGSIQVAGTRSYVTGTLPGAGFIYNGTTNQITGNNLPLNITNFTINTTATLTMSRDLAIAGAATFTAGMLSINGNTLTLNGTTNIAGSGSISGGSTSKMIVAGSSGLATNLPDINNGLFSLYINKTGAGNDIYLRAGETLTIYNAGTLTLQAGVLRNANTLIMGENASALTNIVRYGYNSSLNGTPTFNNKVNLTYMAPGGTGTELPTAANVLNNFTITNGGVLTTLSTNATVNGTLTINTFNNGLFLDGRTLTINGDYVNNSSGTFYGSTTSSIIINGNNQSVSQGLIKFNQTSAATRSLANFTLNRTGTGSAFTISTPVEITNAFITSGILTASGGDILMTNTTVGAGGKLINNSGAFPANLPSSPTTRAFNNTTFATVNKFDILNGSAQTGNSISGNGSDLTFTRNGAGSVYALRSRAMSPVVLPTAVIRFNLGVTSTVANTNAAGTLMIGSNLGDNATLPTAAARLQFNLTTANSKITLTSPDGTPYISADNLDLNQTFTWIINNSGNTINYTGPNGTDYSLVTGKSDLWHNQTRLANGLLLQDITQAMQQIKFVMDDGTGSIVLKNLRINPLATITTTPTSCYTAGYTLNVDYTANLAGVAATLASASFNNGNEFRVQLSDANGNFNNGSLVIGKSIINKTNPSGTIQAFIPAYALGDKYRYRVVSTDLLTNISTNNGVSMYYVSPGLSQSMLPSGSGNTLTANTADATLTGTIKTSNSSTTVTGIGTSFLTQLVVGKVLKRGSDNQVLGTVQSITDNTTLILKANAASTNNSGAGIAFKASTATSFQWGYRTTSGSGFTAIPGATFQEYTPTGAHFASGNPGTYYTVCQISMLSCSNVISNEVIVYINCPTGATNFITNGKFDNTLNGTISSNTTSTIITGVGTNFTTQLRVGRRIYRSSDNALLGVIASINSDTQLTLTDNSLYNVTNVTYLANYYHIEIKGTITTSNISPWITGTNTKFLEHVQPGDIIRDVNNTVIGTVLLVMNNTNLMLTGNASGNTTNTKFKTNINSALYTGTISTSTASTTVTGSGTLFNTQIQVGDLIKRSDNFIIGTVASITNATTLTLTTNARLTHSGEFGSNPAVFGNSGIGFNTEYVYNAQDVNQGRYTIGTDPNHYLNIFCSIPPTPTSSSISGGSGGNLLIADANPSATKILWSQTVTGLTPNTNYVLTFNANSLYNPLTTNSLVFGMYLNCNRVGEDITAGFTGECTWAKYSIQVNTGNLTSFELAIANISANGSGNDIALDDIEFYECSAVLATPFAPANKFKWRGISTDWFNSDNWGVCPGILPTCSDDIEIPANMPNYPIISNSGAVARKITIDPNASLTINADRNLNVCGDIINNGVINNLTGATTAATVTFISYSTATLLPNPLPSKQSVKGTSAFTNVIVNQNPVLAGGVSLTSDATINNVLDIRTNNTLSLSGYGLTINGNISANTGTITGSNTSDLIINGSGNAGILRFTSGNRELGHLTMNRASTGQVTLGTDLTLAGSGSSLALANGLINTTTTNLLTLDENATVTGGSSSAPFPSGGSDNSFINGPMAKKVNNSTTSFTFPVGKNNQLREIGITPNNNATTNKVVFKAEYFPVNAYSISSNIEVSIPLLDHISKMEYWILDRTTGTDGVDGGKVRLHWTNYSIASTLISENSTNMRVVRYNQPTDKWQDKGGIVGGTADYNSGYVTSDGANGEITTFSPFTLGSLIPEVPLPVELIDLKAVAVKKAIQVSWQTANEHNSAHFIVERSGDGVNFTALAKIAAAGNSKTVRNYVYTDLNPLSGTNYYRLQQVDRDATVAASKIVWADILEETETGFELYPNPSHGGAFSIQLAYSGEIQVSIYDLAGVEVELHKVKADGQMASISPRKNLSQGMYIVRVVTPTHSYQHKLIVK